MTEAEAGRWSFEDWRRGRVWWTADLHLGHERILELCDRPFGSVEKMNDAIIGEINRAVGPRDTLVVVGDVLLGKFEVSVRLLSRIRAGRVWLVPGNHDRWSLAYGHRGTVEAKRTRREIFRGLYEAARRSGAEIHCSVDRQPSAWGVEIGGRRVLVSHYPYLGGGDSRGGGGAGAEDRYGWLRARPGAGPLICGHVHGAWRESRDGLMLNVGVDANGYAPVSEETIRDWLAGIPAGAGLARTP